MSSSLSKYVSWGQLLPLLGAKVTAPVLPASAACPACQGARLLIYKDQAFGGEWAHCRDCDFHGDMIEVAAARWKLDLPATLRKLAFRGLQIPPQALQPTALTTYSRLVEYRRAADEFWQNLPARPQEDAHDDFWRLQQKLGLTLFIEDAVASKFFRWASTKQVDTFFRRYARHSDLFRGPGWRNVLTIPYYDLPGRICGFLFIGREGLPETDYVYRPLHPPVKGAWGEAGVSMLWTLLGPPSQHLGDTTFVTDPVTALQVQLRWLHTNLTPLPLVGSYYSHPVRTGRFWSAMAGRERIFWSPQRTSQQFFHAIAGRGRIANLQARGAFQADAHSGLDWLRLFRLRSHTWRAALEQELRSRSAEEAEQLLLEIEIPPKTLQAFVDGCDAELRTRLERIWSQQLARRQVIVRGSTLSEEADGWYIQRPKRPPEQICNGRLRIEQIVHAREGRQYYRGTIELGGQSHTFVERVDAVERLGIFKILRERLGITTPALWCDPKWAGQAVLIATKFHEPEAVAGIDQIGWIREHSHFRFANFVLSASGQLEHDNAGALTQMQLPTKQLQPPGIILERDLKQLVARSPAAHIFWAVAAGVLDAILAPVFGETPRGLALAGEGAGRVGLAVAEQLGCQRHAFPLPHGGAAHYGLQVLLRLTREHNWPAVFHTGPKPAAELIRRWVTDGGAGSVLAVDWCTGQVAQTYGWNVVDYAGPCPLMPTPAAPMLLASYLQDLCRRRFDLPTPYNTRAHNLLADLATWLKRTTGLAFSRRDVAFLLHAAGEQPAWQSLLVLNEHFAANPPAVEHAGDIWISQPGINTLLTRCGAPVLDIAAMTETLQAECVLLGEETLNQARGWLVDRDWWQRQQRLWRANQGRTLRVVT